MPLHVDSDQGQETTTHVPLLSSDTPSVVAKSALKKPSIAPAPPSGNAAEAKGAATKFDCTVLKKGWGFKEGSFVKSWRKRWFILREKMQREFKSLSEITHVLLYFQTMEQAANGLIPTGAIPLSSTSTRVEALTRSGRNCLAITTNGVKRVLYLQPCGKVKKEAQDPEAKETSMQEALGEWRQILTTFEVPSGFGRLRMDTLGQPPVRVSQLIEDEYGSEDDSEGVSYAFATDTVVSEGEEPWDVAGSTSTSVDIGPENEKFKSVLQNMFLLKQTYPNNIAMKAFDMAYFNTLTEDDKASLLQIVNSGIENPDSSVVSLFLFG